MSRVGCAGARLGSERALKHSEPSDALLRTDESNLLFYVNDTLWFWGAKTFHKM